MSRTVLVFVLTALLVNAQAIIQQGVAAAGGTLAGSMAGKHVSDAIDKALAATSAAAKTSAEAKPVSRSKSGSGGVSPSAIPTDPEWLRKPASVQSRQKPRRAPIARPTPETHGPETASALPEFLVVPAEVPTPPAPVVLSADDLREVPAGAARQDVLAKLGTPASQVTIPEDGGLREILYYSANGETLGTVRMFNGAVIAVQIQRP